MKKTYKNPCVYIVTLEKSDHIIMTSHVINAYDRIISDYNSEENSLTSKINFERTNAQNALAYIGKNKEKELFLKSYIDNVMTVKIHELHDRFRYKTIDINDILDPLFEQIAKEVTIKQRFFPSQFYNVPELHQDIKRVQRIRQQLIDCGIIKYDRYIYVAQFKTTSELDRFLKQLNGKNLLTIADKHRVNDYLDKRRKELGCNDIGQLKHLKTSPEEEISYAELREKYADVASCHLIAEITNLTTDMNYKSSAKISVSRNKIYLLPLENFNYVWPSQSKTYKAVCIPTREVTLYFYPQFLIVSRNVSDFNIVDYKNINVSFRVTRFLENEPVADAEFIEMTYTYINKNGEKDMRYSQNPQLYKYLYGELTFDISTIGFKTTNTLQFSNVSKTRMFYDALTKLISLKKRI